MVLKKLKTVFCAGLIVSSFVGFFVYQHALCSEAVSVKDGLLSVNLKDTSLLEVARDIEKQSGVWFRGDETLFQEKISLIFNDLTLEEGLKRILTNLNYSLMFDNKNKVAGVMVMGEGKPAGAQPGRPGAQPPRVATPPGTTTRPAPTARTRPSVSTPPVATVRRPPRVVPQPAQSGTASQTPGSAPAQSALPDAFKAQENATAPGGPAASDGPLPPAFRIIENAPPPGGPVADKETPEAFKVIRNAPPPGGSGEGTGVTPGGSTPAKNAFSPGDAAKSDTTP
ncbi:MAG TPA: hypothetical protein VGA86_03830 [Desulfatiglandales bacterium]